MMERKFGIGKTGSISIGEEEGKNVFNIKGNPAHHRSQKVSS